MARLDWPRDDLNLAGVELLIGLAFLSDPPRDDADWHERYDSPDPDRLQTALAPFAPYFELAGEGPRFLQDRDPFETDSEAPKVHPPDMLFLDSAGGNAAKRNADLMVRRGRYPSLPLPLAAIALYTLQAYASGGGRGMRTSMRGGGPMVTLVRPRDGSVYALWRRVWANVPEGQPLSPDQAGCALPWLRPTRTSEREQIVTPDMSHPAEAFFGMPRRLRLEFGHRSVTGVRQKQHGTNYSGWIHPLSPYYRPKPGTEWLPCLTKPGRTSYRNWLGLTFGKLSETRQVARVVERFQFLTNAPDWEVEAGGWAMKSGQATALDFGLHVYPAYRLPVESEDRVVQLVEATSGAAKALSSALRKALTSPKLPGKPVTFAGRNLNLISEDLFIDTESAFTRAIEAIAGGEEQTVEETWLAMLRQKALAAFDQQLVPTLVDRNVATIQRTIEARKKLLTYFARPTGIRQILDLPDRPPEPRP